MNFDVVGIGQSALDCLGVADLYPKVDEKTEVSSFKIEGGGPTATAMVTLSRLKIPVSFVGKVGNDYFGMLIKRELKAEGVDISGMVTEENKTSQFAFICVEKETGKRNVFFTRGSITPLIFDEIKKELIANCKILHLDGLMIEASIKAAKHAKSLGKKVSLDAGTLRDGMIELCKHTDYLVTSEKFAMSYIQSDTDVEHALKALKQLGPEIVCITLGEKGSIALKDGEIIRQPAYKVKVVDTTGAGDVYHGAFLYGILMGYDIRKTLKTASFISALKCRKLGGRSGIPKAGEYEIL